MIKSLGKFLLGLFVGVAVLMAAYYAYFMYADKSKLGKKNAENQPTRHAVSSTKKQLSFARTNLARNTVSVCTRTSCRRIDQQETALLDKA